MSHCNQTISESTIKTDKTSVKTVLKRFKIYRQRSALKIKPYKLVRSRVDKQHNVQLTTVQRSLPYALAR